MICHDKNRFEVLAAASRGADICGIGTYKEKRLHKILKEFFCEDARQTEVKIGRYVADLVLEGEIYEIQTGSFYPLCEKLKYYTEQTHYPVNIVYPVIAGKNIIRVDKESGEFLRAKKSPVRKGAGEVLRQLYWISDFFPHPRVKILVFLITADEFRFSDVRRRRNREGRYDKETFPRELAGIETFSTPGDLIPYLPDIPPAGVTASEFSALTGLKGRQLYAVLNFCASKGLLIKVKPGAGAAKWEKP